MTGCGFGSSHAPVSLRLWRKLASSRLRHAPRRRWQRARHTEILARSLRSWNLLRCLSLAEDIHLKLFAVLTFDDFTQTYMLEKLYKMYFYVFLRTVIISYMTGF